MKTCYKSQTDVYFCSTLEERAERLYLTKGKRIEDLDQSMFTKNKPGKSAKGK